MSRYYLISSQAPTKQIFIKNDTFKIGRGKLADLQVDRPSIQDIHLTLFPGQNKCMAQGTDCYIIHHDSNLSPSMQIKREDLKPNCAYDYQPNDTIGIRDFTFTIHSADPKESAVSFPLEAVQQSELKPRRSTVVQTTPGAIKGTDLNINIGSLEVQDEVCPVNSKGEFVTDVGDVELVRDCGVPATIEDAGLDKVIETGDISNISNVLPNIGGVTNVMDNINVVDGTFTKEVFMHKEEIYEERILTPGSKLESDIEVQKGIDIPALQTDNYNVMGNVFMDTPSMQSMPSELDNMNTPIFDNIPITNNDMTDKTNISQYSADVVENVEALINNKEKEFEVKTSMLIDEIEKRVDEIEERVDEKMEEIENRLKNIKDNIKEDKNTDHDDKKEVAEKVKKEVSKKVKDDIKKDIKESVIKDVKEEVEKDIEEIKEKKSTGKKGTKKDDGLIKKNGKKRMRVSKEDLHEEDRINDNAEEVKIEDATKDVGDEKTEEKTEEVTEKKRGRGRQPKKEVESPIEVKKGRGRKKSESVEEEVKPTAMKKRKSAVVAEKKKKKK